MVETGMYEIQKATNWWMEPLLFRFWSWSIGRMQKNEVDEVHDQVKLIYGSKNEKLFFFSGKIRFIDWKETEDDVNILYFWGIVAHRYV